MRVMIEMPLSTYHGFIGRCLLTSRAYAILKNSVISHVPEYKRDGNMIECFCELEDAKVLLDQARRFYPAAASYIEEAARLAAKPSSVPPQIEYRKLRSGETWHFCSHCSHWPTDDFLSLKDFPEAAQLCNECVVKAQHGEC